MYIVDQFSQEVNPRWRLRTTETISFLCLSHSRRCFLKLNTHQWIFLDQHPFTNPHFNHWSHLIQICLFGLENPIISPSKWTTSKPITASSIQIACLRQKEPLEQLTRKLSMERKMIDPLPLPLTERKYQYETKSDASPHKVITKCPHRPNPFIQTMSPYESLPTYRNPPSNRDHQPHLFQIRQPQTLLMPKLCQSTRKPQTL